MKRVYVDTNVLVYHFVTLFNQGFSMKSKEFLQKVQNGDYEALISLYALSELIKQLRELMVKSNVCSKDEWEANIKRCLEALYRMKNVRIIESVAAEKDSKNVLSALHSEIASDTFNLMTKHPGRIKRAGSTFVHDGIHPIDAIHIVLAKKTGCSAIATFDRDFEETNAEMAPLLLMEDKF